MTLIDRTEPANLLTAHPIWSGEDTGTASSRIEVSEHLRPLVEELEALLRLRPGWDSYGGLPTTTKAARAALSALARLSWAGPLPTVSPLSDGGVTLEWGGDDDGVELTFSPAGTVTGLVDVHESILWEFAVESPTDPSLHEALAWADKLA